ncbi:hypothetical protein SSX86_024789 [Deinandra increscens subsp. villosa]|uniref:RNA-directed DNA polymerase, eukaryota, Reverse transcriptase zinc-binding domain protein n=1 Tax=Deinandra increscens subsp. villosa TaxID=3103831 RepID=A0AAP0GNB8_9ASTR
MMVRSRTNLRELPASWMDISLFLMGKPIKSVAVVIDKLVVHVSAYFIWQERNNRIFNDHARPPDLLVKKICEVVRNRLISLKLKITSKNQHVLDSWGIGAGEDDYVGLM